AAPRVIFLSCPEAAPERISAAASIGIVIGRMGCAPRRDVLIATDTEGGKKPSHGIAPRVGCQAVAAPRIEASSTSIGWAARKERPRSRRIDWICKVHPGL